MHFFYTLKVESFFLKMENYPVQQRLAYNPLHFLFFQTKQ